MTPVGILQKFNVLHCLIQLIGDLVIQILTFEKVKKLGFCWCIR